MRSRVLAEAIQMPPWGGDNMLIYIHYYAPFDGVSPRRKDPRWLGASIALN